MNIEYDEKLKQYIFRRNSQEWNYLPVREISPQIQNLPTLELYSDLEKLNLAQDQLSIFVHELWNNRFESFENSKCIYNDILLKNQLYEPNSPCKSERRLLRLLGNLYNFTSLDVIYDIGFVESVTNYQATYITVNLNVSFHEKLDETVYFVNRVISPKLVYCFPSFDHQTIDFLYIFRPLDLFSSSLFIIISILTFYSDLNGAKNIRQQLCLFISISTFLACAIYECFLSSDVTLPPPPTRIYDFNELLGKAYKIIMFTNNNSTNMAIYYYMIQNLKRDRRIKTNEVSFLELVKDNFNVKILEGLYAEMTHETHLPDFFDSFSYKIRFLPQDEFKEFNKTVKVSNKICSTLENDPFKNHELLLTYEFHKYGRMDFYKTSEKIQTSGILIKWDEWNEFKTNFNFKKEEEKRKHSESQPNAFKFLNWRILPIFAIESLLLSICLSVFLMEISYFHRVEIWYMLKELLRKTLTIAREKILINLK